MLEFEKSNADLYAVAEVTAPASRWPLGAPFLLANWLPMATGQDSFAAVNCGNLWQAVNCDSIECRAQGGRAAVAVVVLIFAIYKHIE